MEQYKKIWPWMIAPMIIMQAGIFYDYWGDFAENTWAVHIHYALASTWYLFLILQPWFFAKGKMAQHRTFGIIGMFLAGGVAFTAISQLNRDILYANYVGGNPGAIGPFEPWFFLGIAISEIILISAFIAAIIMAIVKRKSPEDHAWWLISTVFIIMMPALARGLQAGWVAVYGETPGVTIIVMPPIYMSQALIILMTLAAAWFLKRVKHPATYLALSANFAVFFMEPLGRNEFLQDALRFVIKV